MVDFPSFINSHHDFQAIQAYTFVMFPGDLYFILLSGDSLNKGTDHEWLYFLTQLTQMIRCWPMLTHFPWNRTTATELGVSDMSKLGVCLMNPQSATKKLKDVGFEQF